MQITLIILLALGLSMDAFAISVTNGMCARGGLLKVAFGSGAAFGIFQGLMPLIGFYAGSSFHSLLEQFDHWVAFLLLGAIGGKMVAGALRDLRRPAACPAKQRLSVKALLFQSVATSVDALAVGISLGVMQVNIFFTSLVIALVTFGCCFAGVFVGRSFGLFLNKKAELFGGVVLILIGLRILLAHLSG